MLSLYLSIIFTGATRLPAVWKLDSLFVKINLQHGNANKKRNEIPGIRDKDHLYNYSSRKMNPLPFVIRITRIGLETLGDLFTRITSLLRQRSP